LDILRYFKLLQLDQNIKAEATAQILRIPGMPATCRRQASVRCIARTEQYYPGVIMRLIPRRE
jgi:hypothetical protein